MGAYLKTNENRHMICVQFYTTNRNPRLDTMYNKCVLLIFSGTYISILVQRMSVIYVLIIFSYYLKRAFSQCFPSITLTSDSKNFLFFILLIRQKIIRIYYKIKYLNVGKYG